MLEKWFSINQSMPRPVTGNAPFSLHTLSILYAFLPTFPSKDKGPCHVPDEAQETHLLLRP